MNFTFSRYVIEDSGIRLWFVCSNPGAGRATDYDILMIDSELSALTTPTQRLAAIKTKLQRKIQAAGIASVLDPLIGSVVTI